jgi:Flp pilus assembly protein TadG
MTRRRWPGQCRHPRRRERSRGQVLVIFALAIVGLFAAAGLAFDIGRFYTEKRFLQNAADAGALAGVDALIRGASQSEADAEIRSVLQDNLANSPNGSNPALPPTTPQYESGHAGEAAYLSYGILVSGCDVRVAVQSTVQYTFGRVVGLDANTIGGRAHARCDGNMLPIAVRRYVNVPGPNSGATSPCPSDSTQFTDFFSTADTSCLGTDTDASLRSVPSAGMAFDSIDPGSDPSDHGPVVAILGQGAQPSNNSDFRGFIALDIRNFQTSTSQLYYNGVTAGTTNNTLKSFEAGWISQGGYPGPAFPPVISPPDPNDQVAIMSGNDTGVAIDAVNAHFAPGDEVLVAVYSGTTMEIPDFSVAAPAPIVIQPGETLANVGSFRVARNQAFSGTVTLTTLADTLDPQNPMVTGALVGSDPISYSPNPVTPSLGAGTQVQMQDLTATAAAVPGIYTIWIEGQAGSPYLTTKYTPVALQVGSVSRDFEITASAGQLDAVNTGDTATVDLDIARTGNKDFGGPISLSLDTPLPTGMGSVTFSPSSVTPVGKNGASSTLSIDTGTMAPGTYRIVVRATGTNTDSSPHKVTHLLPLTLSVGMTGSAGNQSYVDITGFAVMRIASMDSNTIDAYAISGVYADMNDPALRRGQAARLVPWS